MTSALNNIIVICGPTCSGKSDIANRVAYKINGEVVSADSMQVYSGMDIGTGKILPSEKLVKHYGLDIVTPDQSYSVALYQKYSRDCFKNIWENRKTPVLCGGTGFYIRAAIDNYTFPKGEQINNPIREKYQKFLINNSTQDLWNILDSKDPESANLIHPNNSVRVIRALELLEEGQTYANQQKKLHKISQKYQADFYALSIERHILYERINNRVNQMILDGLVNEVKTLLDNNYRESLTSVSAIGYKEIVDYFDGRCSLDQSIEQIKKATRNYAKRQLTWFRKDKRIKWLDYNDFDSDRVVNQILSNYE